MANAAADRRFGIVAGIPAEIAARRLHELDVGHAVEPRELQSTHQLLGIEIIERSGAHRRIVPQDHALDPFDHPDADHETRAHGNV